MKYSHGQRSYRTPGLLLKSLLQCWGSIRVQVHRPPRTGFLFVHHNVQPRPPHGGPHSTCHLMLVEGPWCYPNLGRMPCGFWVRCSRLKPLENINNTGPVVWSDGRPAKWSSRWAWFSLDAPTRVINFQSGRTAECFFTFLHNGIWLNRQQCNYGGFWQP